jgi:transcriptional regulator with XRE-family HTH domain
VAELARQAGISKATVWSLESGEGNPTIDTLAAVAAALRLPLGDLVLVEVRPEPTLRESTEPPDYSKQELLHRIGPDRVTEIWRLRIRSVGQRIASPPHARGTIEHILVLRGAAAIGPDEAPVVLRAGDFAAFAADAPHSYEAVEPDVDAAVLMAYPAH